MGFTPLQIAIASNALASGVLASAFFYLWLQRREMSAPVFWGTAYLCYCVRQVLILLYVPSVPLVADFLFNLVPLLILAGTLLFLGRRAPYRWLTAMAVLLMLGATAGYYGFMPRLVWLQLMLGAATAVLFATGGLLLFHRHRSPETAHIVLAVLFILWGAILSTFPLLMHDMTLRAGYYLANAAALLLIALALIVVSQRQQYLEAQRARAALETANQRFQDIVDTATAWIWEWDTERRIRFVSPRASESLGIKPDLFIGRRLHEVPGVVHVDLSEAEAGRVFTPDGPFRNVPLTVTTAAGKRVRLSVSGKPIFDDEGRHTGFRGITIDITHTSRMQATLDTVLGGIAQNVGPDYFRALVERLARDLGGDTVLVGRCVEDGRVQALAAWGDGVQQPDVEYALSGAPCATTLADGLLIVERDAARLYPDDSALAERGFQGYAGVALRGANGAAIGLIALLTKTPIVDTELIRNVLTATAPRAGAEMERQVAEAALRENEARFRAVLDNMPIAFHLVDSAGRYVLRNRTLAEWSGTEVGRYIGQTMGEVVGAKHEDYAEVGSELQEVLRSGRVLIRERAFIGLNGTTRPALVSRFPIFDDAGKIAFVATFINDLSEVRHLEAQVREREALLSTILDHMPVGFHLTDMQGHFVMRNRTIDEWTGVARHEVLGRTHADVADRLPYDYAEVQAELRQAISTGRPVIRERINRDRDGFERPLLICRYPIFDDAGTVRFVASLLTDVTEVKRLEAEVREREQLFRTVIDNMPLAFYLTDADGRFVLRNRTLADWAGPGWEPQPGHTLAEIARHLRFDLENAEAELREVVNGGRPIMVERDLTPGAPQPRPALVCRFPIHDESGKAQLVGTLLTDVSDLKRLEGQVRQSEARLQRVVSALDRSRRGVVVEDADNRPIYVNRTASELMGSESSAFAMLMRAGVGSEFDAHGTWSGEVIHRTRNGNDAILQASIARLPDGGSVTLLDDATERLERERSQAALERQVQESQKMDAVGQLAGGIAHDFNNLIGAILGFARFIAEDTDEKSRLHVYATRILSASQRARELIQQILAFSRRESAPRQPAAITRLLEESAQLLRATVPATLSLDVRNDFPEAWAIVNQTQITQILVNLCLNAADATGGRPGTLTLALERLPEIDPRRRWLLASDPGGLPKIGPAVEPGQPSRCCIGALRPGSPYLVLSVRDEGPGIPPQQLAKIFDPFFTTKPRGRGTGLGLSVVQRLVLSHEGAIVVTTRPGAGTTFDIILPVSGHSERGIVEAVTRDEPAVSQATLVEAKGRVLVVDDDLHFGDMISTALDRAGYEIGICARPREAIDLLSQRPQGWDVLVTDQTMPEMSGLELIGHLRALNPNLRCILCTGYASSSLDAETAKSGGADAFFHKPVDVEALKAMITTLMSSNGEARFP